MATSIKLPDELVKLAKKVAAIEHRSTPKQIELWSEIGRAVLDNPDLPPGFILETLHSLKEAKEGFLQDYDFD